MSMTQRFYAQHLERVGQEDMDEQEWMRELYDELSCDGRFPPFSALSDDEIEDRMAA